VNFKTELDAYKFIMNIETYILESTPVPFTNKVMVDKDVMYDFLDRLRSRLPKEMKECQRIIEKKQLEDKINSNGVEDKQKECEEMLKQAEQQAQEIITGAYEYADKIVARFQSQLEKQIIEVEEGRNQIANTTLKLRKGIK